jgi:hypothetical protein
VFIGANASAGGCGATCQVGLVYYGAAGGLGSHVVIQNPVSGGGWFATSGASAVDVNADGYSDLIMGDGYWNNAVNYVFLGGPSGIAATPATTLNAGGLATSLGDVNGDGFADVLVAPFDGTGNISIFDGALTGLPATPSQTLPVPSNLLGNVPQL